jgi:hypothetical protein
MKITSGLILTVFCLSACKWGGAAKKQSDAVFKDTLTYTYYAIHKRAADCGSKPDSACTVVKIEYPIFKGKSTLNDTIKKRLAQLFIMNDRKPDTSLDVTATAFLKSYSDFKKHDPKSVMFFTLNSYAKVIEQDSSLLTLEYGGYNFQGGAHGASYTGFINWNVKTDKNVTLDDIFAPGYHAELNKIAERIFRKEEKLSDTASFARDYFFKGNKFTLNSNYCISPAGIRFIYNQYEIKPYAAGTTELLIPYSAVKSLMRPHSAASQYIERNAGI